MSRAVLLAFLASLIPMSATAAEKPARPEPGVLEAAVKTIAVDGERGARPATAATVRSAQQPPSQRSGSFFRSKPGILAIAVMAVGAGYALYSAQEDRIKSPGKAVR